MTVFKRDTRSLEDDPALKDLPLLQLGITELVNKVHGCVMPDRQVTEISIASTYKERVHVILTENL